MNESDGGINNVIQVTISSHNVSHLNFQIVWVCKYRRRILNPRIFSYLRKLLPEFLRSIPDTEIETIGFDHDHLHIVLMIPPRYR